MAKKKQTNTNKKNTSPQPPASKAKKQSTTPSKSKDFLVVGIGASAGGLDSFKQFFEKMPATTGMAFVIVQHLDPTHKSMLSDLLRNFTQMKVMEVKDNTKVLPNTIYTIPPNKEMGILNGVLKLMEPTESRGSRRTIDYFFRSLADDQKVKAVGIVLSGTGTEGAIGLKAIKGVGGLSIVQNPDTAKYDGMPRSAIAANAADIVLPVQDIPQHLVSYMKKRKIKPIATKEDELIPKQSLLDKIFLILRDRTGNNFSHYKMSTTKRRIDKRMAINQISRLDLKVKPLTQTSIEEQLLMVLFEEIKPSETIIPKPKSKGGEDHAQIVELEHELASTKEYLRTTIEELEISNEELKSSNEELQSANEEMITVNTELQNKIYELTHAHDDMVNLLASTAIGTIFL